MSSPIYNPSVPYTASIPGGFLPGRMVRVQGRVNPSANSFTINLQTGPSPYDDVALHVNSRFNEGVIVRNARMQSSWGSEERHGPPMPIYRDQNFEILIMSEASSFNIAVNGQHFSEFNHRIQPLDRINHLNIEGDLTVSLIQFDGAVTQSSAYGATAPPMGYGHGGGGVPYPPASAMPSPGFVMPGGPAAASPYPSSAPGGYPPPQQPAYGGYPPQQPAGYPGGGAPGGYPGGYPAGGAPGGYPGGYPAGGAPGGYPGGYPSGGAPAQGGYYQPGGPSHGGSGSSGGGGLMGNASKLLAGGLAGVGLAKVANKIPGLGGGGHHGSPSYGHQGGGHGGGHGGGPLGAASGLLGPAAALGIGGLVANKAMGGKKSKGNKLMKYGLPVGGAVLGGYALKKGMKGFGHHGHHGGSSSSSSSSSEEE